MLFALAVSYSSTSLLIYLFDNIYASDLLNIFNFRVIITMEKSQHQARGFVALSLILIYDSDFEVHLGSPSRFLAISPPGADKGTWSHGGWPLFFMFMNHPIEIIISVMANNRL